jgi:hypothetical protein
MSSNLAKYICRLLPLEQQHKIEKETKTLTVASHDKIILTIFGKKDFYLEIRKIISKMLQNYTKLSKQH